VEVEVTDKVAKKLKDGDHLEVEIDVN